MPPIIMMLTHFQLNGKRNISLKSFYLTMSVSRGCVYISRTLKIIIELKLIENNYDGDVNVDNIRSNNNHINSNKKQQLQLLQSDKNKCKNN